MGGAAEDKASSTSGRSRHGVGGSGRCGRAMAERIREKICEFSSQGREAAARGPCSRRTEERLRVPSYKRAARGGHVMVLRAACREWLWPTMSPELWPRSDLTRLTWSFRGKCEEFVMTVRVSCKAVLWLCDVRFQGLFFFIITSTKDTNVYTLL